MRCRTAIAGTILRVAPSLNASPFAAQQVVELPAEDRIPNAADGRTGANRRKG